MTQPSLTVLGVYRPAISPETWQEQWQVTGDDEITREHFDKLVAHVGCEKKELSSRAPLLGEGSPPKCQS